VALFHTDREQARGYKKHSRPTFTTRFEKSAMGLTIHYTLSVKRGTLVRFITNLLRRTQRLARKNGCAYVGKVLHSTESDPDAPPFFDCVPGRERRLHGGGPGTHGWLLEVWPGEGCETAVFGILQHRRELAPRKYELGWMRRYSKCSDWKLDAFCKTQYAGEHGWEHFRACHLRVIQLLDLWRDAGARVKVWDEGGYWKTRSEARLLKEVAEYDRLIAALGGVFKDGYRAGEVVAPIFSYKNFEQLEHEGQQLVRERIQPLRKVLTKAHQ
jgi:hypothetical protein